MIRIAPLAGALAVTLTLLSASTQGAATTVFRCRDADGRLTFSDTPCAPASAQETVEVPPANQVQSRVPDRPTRDRQANAGGRAADGEEAGTRVTDLAQALRDGVLRAASARDFERWVTAAAPSEEIRARLARRDGYVVLEPVVLDVPMGGAHSVYFVVDDPALAPGGKLMHSVVLFTDTGACLGVTCR